MPLRNLTLNEIDQLLKKYPDAQKTIVKNFLLTVANCEYLTLAFEYIRQNAKLHHWNVQTVLAVKEGTEKAIKKVTLNE